MERDGISGEDSQLLRYAECRYRGQGYELRLECPDGVIDQSWVAEVGNHFHDVHEREYYRAYRDAEIQIVNVRVRGVGASAGVSASVMDDRPEAVPSAVHQVWFRVDGEPTALDTSFYLRDELAPGQTVEGPAIVQQFESTTVIPPGGRATVDPHGILMAKTMTATSAPVGAGERSGDV